MGMRKIRNAKVTHTGRRPVHHYEQRDGITTLTGVEEAVQVVMEVTDEGPEKGREVIVVMSRTEALAHIRALSDAVQAGRDKELDAGTPDSEAAPVKMERIPGTDILRPAHEHVFRSPHSDEVCYAVEWCMLTYGEPRRRAHNGLPQVSGEELDAGDRAAMSRLARRALTQAADNPHSPGCPSIRHRH